MIFYSGRLPKMAAFLAGLLLFFSIDAPAQKIISGSNEETQTTDAVSLLKENAQSESEEIHAGDRLKKSDLRDSQDFLSEKNSAPTDDQSAQEDIAPDTSGQIEKRDFAYRFSSPDSNDKHNDLKHLFPEGNFLRAPPPPGQSVHDNSAAEPGDEARDDKNALSDDGFQWRPAIQQSLLFLAVQHGYAFTQPKTREALKGKFFKDYVDSVKSLRGWEDGGRFFTNYIAHPMQGALTGFIYVQNDPRARKIEFAESKAYWTSRLKAMAWSAAWSTQFEIGPISQASIGNVGLKGKQTWVDIVITPTVGTAMLMTEEALDRFIMKRIERGTDNLFVRIFARMLLSPSRNFSNLLRFKKPWYRDRPIEQ